MFSAVSSQQENHFVKGISSNNTFLYLWSCLKQILSSFAKIFNFIIHRTLAARVRRFRLNLFLLQSEKKSLMYFLLSFALGEYKRRTLGAPVSLIYNFFGSKRKKIPYLSLIFRFKRIWVAHPTGRPLWKMYTVQWKSVTTCIIYNRDTYLVIPHIAYSWESVVLQFELMCYRKSHEEISPRNIWSTKNKGSKSF
jgi:hypothetical protein